MADWAISGMGNGVDAFGLGGPEVDHPPEKFEKAFQKARDAGLPSVPHAGETVGLSFTVTNTNIDDRVEPGLPGEAVGLSFTVANTNLEDRAEPGLPNETVGLSVIVANENIDARVEPGLPNEAVGLSFTVFNGPTE